MVLGNCFPTQALVEAWKEKGFDKEMGKGESKWSKCFSSKPWSVWYFHRNMWNRRVDYYRQMYYIIILYWYYKMCQYRDLEWLLSLSQAVPERRECKQTWLVTKYTFQWRDMICGVGCGFPWGQSGRGHCPNSSAPGSCQGSFGRLGHAGALDRWSCQQLTILGEDWQYNRNMMARINSKR